jgi:uncharacterized protein YxjI
MPDYLARKRRVSIGRDYVIEDKSGAIVYKLNGKVRFARRFDIEDRDGNSLLAVREKLFTIDSTFEIKREGNTVAVVRRLTTDGQWPAKFEVRINGEVALSASGSFLGEGIEIRRGESRVGHVSRKPYTIVDEIFNVYADANEDQPLILAIAMSIVETDRHRGQDVSG